MDFKDLPKAYEAKDVEDGIYKRWEESGFFNPDKLPERNQNGAPYCISMPPPNVTGVLHLGHAFENALMDTMIRFQRMHGKKAVIIPGTDHAAIATQAKVEKMLMDEGMKYPREELGREKLVERIREFAEESKATMINQIRKVGTSCDWSRLAYTFDEERNVAVNEMFRRMYEDGLIYRGYRVVNWTVKGQSTCSDDEIEYVDRKAKLYTFKYGKDFPLSIATTRPETKLGDTAVAVNPTDERYKQYIGQTITVDVGAAKPLELKVIADDEVDPKFGTGAVGVTPAHSPVDFAMYEKQKAKNDPIKIIPVIGEDGKMTAEAGSAYAGLSVEEAREKFVQYLKDNDLLIKEEEIDQSVGTSDRYKDVIEVIPKTQWWLDVSKEIPGRGKSLRDLMREAVTTGLDGDAHKKVTITPERINKEYLDRVDNLRDWCLSRQIWWGHRIPMWYKGEETKFSVESPGEGWEQDPDTLDTWFSSGSWTFSSLGWPNETEDLKIYHPTAWMQMGYEIRYLWLMRMVLMSTYLFNDIPFYDCYIHGILRDKDGKKFSKSSGNGIDPIEVVDQYGSDALRISLLFGISPGNDSRFYDEKIESGRNFANKLWNISRYILTNIEPGTWNMDLSESEVLSSKFQVQSLADQWILARLEEVVSSVTHKLETYQFSQAGEELRDFTWSDLADWYLEIAKVEKDKSGILLHILKTLLKLWHPFMPFVTEYIWSQFNQDQLIVAPWPTVSDSGLRTPDSSASFETLRTLITDLRRLRSEQNIEPAKKVEFAITADPGQRELIEQNLEVIKALSRAESIAIADTIAEGWVTDVSGSMTIGLNLAGTINVEAERSKLQKEIAELTPYIATTEAKLANAEFTSKAPEHVVNGMKEKLKEAKTKHQALTERLNTL
ncbi:MAG: valine--tRNA ligase [Patescibacteria group bacterium]